MVEIDQQNDLDEKCVTQPNDANVFDINNAIESSTVVQSSENPYYVGMYDIPLEVNEINETTDGDSIPHKTENLYYNELDDIDLEGNIINEEI